MKHILFIDPIEKLNIKKDSSLMLALALRKEGHEVYLLFEKDFYLTSDDELALDVYDFYAEHADDGYYLKEMRLESEASVSIDKNTYIHMRIDPPYDMRYQRYLWMLDFIEKKYSARVSNRPLGIMKYNEKLVAIIEEYGIQSFIGASHKGLKKFLEELRSDGHEEVVIKPMDLYSGIGVKKFSLDQNLDDVFAEYVKEYQGAVLVQPFMKEVLKGEHRSLYFRGEHLGTIIKIPPQGDFLTNIAQGATYEESELSPKLQKLCHDISKDLEKDGIDFTAFDVLGDKITEMNITCPGLIVEVSYACKKNIATLLARAF
jgi:glutathione synthase